MFGRDQLLEDEVVIAVPQLLGRLQARRALQGGSVLAVQFFLERFRARPAPRG